MKISTYKDYIEKVHEEFPDVNKRSINSVVRHGLFMLTFFINKGLDVYLYNNRDTLYYYFGDVSRTKQGRYEIFKRKIRRKIRIMHSLKKTPYSGYMYFGLTDEKYQWHLEGKPQNVLLLYKCIDEVTMFKRGHCFRIAMENPKKWCMLVQNFDTTDAEPI